MSNKPNAAPRETHANVAPDRRPLTQLQAKRFAALSGATAKELVGVAHADLAEKFKWTVDPKYFLMHRVCGQVVKKDPVTGVEYPVPFATVHIEDTDCNLIGYFPKGWKWGWYFPIGCHREVIATVKTDECGKFCAWIPWFDIDAILRWRAERICFDDIFIRPSIADLFDDLVEGPWPPIKVPDKGDPSPIERLAAIGNLGRERLAANVGAELAERLAGAAQRVSFGAHLGGAAGLAGRRAFDGELPAPLPAELRPLNATSERRERAGAANFSLDAVRAGVAARLNVDPKLLAAFDPRRVIGPFRRCVTILVPEWMLVVDVPDITFRVTQDVNGDGTEETIYNEGYFDVRWNAGSIPDVKLQASPIAVSGKICDGPIVRCGNAPEIQFAGLMPLSNLPAPAAPYFDALAGYAKRPNRPRPSGNPADPAGDPLQTETPFTRTLQLYGCVEIPGAQFYRLLYRFNGGSQVPFLGLSWPLYRMVGGMLQVLNVTPDANGWYQIVPAADNWHPHQMLLEWPTGAQGRYEVTLQVGNAAKSPLPTTHTVNFQVDNSAPNVLYQTLKWKFASEADAAFELAGRNLLGTCPTIRRGASPADVDVLMEVQVSASHLRDASIGASGCSLATLPFVPGSPAPPHHTAHWHTDALDNSELLFARYRIPAAALEGVYSFGATANSRAFNPAGSDGGHLADWNYDVVYNYTPTAVHVAVING
ncbi:MAG: hypothetical protein U0575_14245 [Phycisphaerales bacterium]